MLKNAIDYLYAEWTNKAAGFVSYGAVGGARAAEHLRLVAGELQMADVQQVALSLLTEFENFSVFTPGNYNLATLDTLLDQVISWSGALAPLRQPARTAAWSAARPGDVWPEDVWPEDVRREDVRLRHLGSLGAGAVVNRQ